MARKRDYRAEYARRQERARQLGHKGYYQRRVAGAERGTEAFQRARGHRGRADLVRSLRPGDLVGIEPSTSARDKQGRWTRVVINVIGEDGAEREYTLTKAQLTDEKLRALIGAIDAAGAIQSPNYPLRSLMEGGAGEGGLDVGEDVAA